ncbi:Uncharacterised protein [Helicobacter fennelliae]|uniref:Uncharacterized protein n=1 Tax=Helicobacter fennelliae TaxID=215 RepID=A0A2X3DYR1_9HELI|nr:PcfJ domain-containing protein [Helicobacter fennelliae]SQC36412.1 Uncharacterised protein [Helicobacter fennelliae]
MQTNTSLIKDYIPFDFNNTNKNILKKYPILRKWQEDKHFSFFIESIKEEYSIFLFRTDCYIPEEFEDSSKARIYLIPNSLLYSLEKISKALATNKDLECLSYCFNLYYFYLLKTIKLREEYNDEYLLKDYTELIYKTKTNINLKIQSVHRILREHDLLINKLNESKIPKNKKLKIHQSFINLKLPQNFKLLKTERELYLQGQKQHNCVYTRKEKINRGTSAIYHLDYQGDYTLEISKRKEKFIIFELKGKHNAEPTQEILSYVREELKEKRESIGVNKTNNEL